jgi:hypothetical protein
MSLLLGYCVSLRYCNGDASLNFEFEVSHDLVNLGREIPQGISNNNNKRLKLSV